MEKKIYLASESNVTVGVNLNLTERKASKLEYTGSTTNTRMTALEAVIGELKKLNAEELTVPVQMFINAHLYTNIINGYFKYWLMTGKTSEGEEIAPEELTLWEEFLMLNSEKNLLVIYKDSSKATLKHKKKSKYYKETKLDKQNDKYITYSWSKVKELVGEPEVEDDMEMDVV